MDKSSDDVDDGEQMIPITRATLNDNSKSWTLERDFSIIDNFTIWSESWSGWAYISDIELVFIR